VSDTAIEWTDVDMEPRARVLQGLARLQNCYAERTAARQAHSGYAGLVRIGEGSPRWTGEVRLVPSELDEPLRWKKPRRVFVNSMSDLCSREARDDEIAACSIAMRLAPQHTFQCSPSAPIGCSVREGAPRRRHRPGPWLHAEVQARNRAAAAERPRSASPSRIKPPRTSASNVSSRRPPRSGFYPWSRYLGR
jgi:protein gp37